MQTKTTHESIQQLIAALQAQTKPRLPKRRDFVVTAILCLVNEGIEPHITAKLKYSHFNFDEGWVDFIPWNGHQAVRRPLSPTTAHYLRTRMRQLKARPEDGISQYRAHKSGGRVPTAQPIYGSLFLAEIRETGFDPGQYTIKRLKWFWANNHPDLREEERRCRMLASFVLRWSAPAEQEVLLQRLFENIPVLRPSWAFPAWHKDALQQPAVEPAATPIPTDSTGHDLSLPSA